MEEEKQTAPAKGRRPMVRLRFQTGLAVLFTAMGAMVVLVLLVVPTQMGLERLFDKCSALLEQRRAKKERRRAARKVFRGRRER